MRLMQGEMERKPYAAGRSRPAGRSRRAASLAARTCRPRRRRIATRRYRKLGEQGVAVVSAVATAFLPITCVSRTPSARTSYCSTADRGPGATPILQEDEVRARRAQGLRRRRASRARGRRESPGRRSGSTPAYPGRCGASIRWWHGFHLYRASRRERTGDSTVGRSGECRRDVVLRPAHLVDVKRHRDPKLKVDCDSPIEGLLPSLGRRLTFGSIVEGDSVEVLENRAFFDALFDEVRSARRRCVSRRSCGRRAHSDRALPRHSSNVRAPVSW